MKGSAREDCATIDSVLERAGVTITPSVLPSPSKGISSTVSPSSRTESLQATSQTHKTVFQSSPVSASSGPKTPRSSSPCFSSATSALADASFSGQPPTNVSSFDTAAGTSTSTYSGRCQSLSFAQGAGNIMPYIEPSCSFFLAAQHRNVRSRCKQCSFHLIPFRILP